MVLVCPLLFEGVVVLLELLLVLEDEDWVGLLLDVLEGLNLLILLVEDDEDWLELLLEPDEDSFVVLILLLAGNWLFLLPSPLYPLSK